MEYIISRNSTLPVTAQEFEAGFRFNLWSRKFWPYEKFEIGDILYWYEIPSGSIVWKTRTVKADRFFYQSKDHLHEMLKLRFGDFDENEPYVVKAPEQGYCLVYKSKALQRLNVPKPDKLRFPQLGWLSTEDTLAQEWLSQIGLDHERSPKRITSARSSFSAEGGTLISRPVARQLEGTASGERAEDLTTYLNGRELLQSGETGLFICTDGLNLVVHPDGTGSSGWWVLNPKRRFDRVFIFKRTSGQSDGAEILAAQCIDYEGPDERRYTLRLINIRHAGTTPRNWREFTGGTQNPIRYLAWDNAGADPAEALIRRAIGAGFSSPDENRRVERAAVAYVTAWYHSQGWQVRTVEGEKRGYDLLCTKGGQQEHVEVKGIRETRPTFIITASELARAVLDTAFRLCVVTEALGDPHLLYLEGGQFKEQAVLTPLAYRAEVHFP
jgi:Domain of unknown function (DUF3883)